MPFAAAALALSLFAGHADRLEHHRYAVGEWRLAVTKDSFARSTTCRLTTHDARIQHGRLVWRLGASVDTSGAVWRIDEGEPRHQALRDLPVSANLANPSDGRLVAPVSLLTGARVIETRPSPHAHVRRLSLARLDEALAAAAAQGCAPL